MSKHSIVIDSINGEGYPLTALGTCNGAPVELSQFRHSTGLLWKTLENGRVAPPTAESLFTKGERSALARWMKLVQLDQDLLGKASNIAQVVNKSPSSAMAALVLENTELKNTVIELKERLAQYEDEDEQEA